MKIGEFLGIFGLMSLIHIITDLLRRYSLHIEDQGKSNTVGSRMLSLVVMIMYINPYTAFFFFLQYQDYKRAARLERED